MTRNEIILQYFQKKDLLTITNPFYQTHISELFTWMVNTDNISHDISLACLHLTGKGEANVICKQNGIIAGLEEIVYLLSKYTKLSILPISKDGSQISKGQKVISISGAYNEILAYERVLLNILGKMSGIATNTHYLVSLLKNQPPYLAATRKTPLMLFDKKAVAIGGGLTHRLNLSDWAMIKDNHLKVLQKETHQNLERVIVITIERMLASYVNFFEIEVETYDQAECAANAFLQINSSRQHKAVMAILLDNFNPINAKEVILYLQNKSKNTKNLLYEVSGGISEKNLLSWANTGVDIISMGTLTHSSPTLDFSLSICE